MPALVKLLSRADETIVIHALLRSGTELQAMFVDQIFRYAVPFGLYVFYISGMLCVGVDLTGLGATILVGGTVLTLLASLTIVNLKLTLARRRRKRAGWAHAAWAAGKGGKGGKGGGSRGHVT